MGFDNALPHTASRSVLLNSAQFFLYFIDSCWFSGFLFQFRSMMCRVSLTVVRCSLLLAGYTAVKFKTEE